MALHESVLSIVKGVRPILLPHFGIAKAINHKSAYDSSAVTKLDIEAEEYLKRELRSVHLDIAFVGEEGGGDRTKERFWLVDPIDGTGNFIRGVPVCTTMLALIENGAVAFSAIYDFVGDNMYWARKGAGAFRNADPIHVSGRDMSRAWLSWEINTLDYDLGDVFLDVYKAFTGHVYKTLTAGWEYAKVAEGVLDARVTFVPYGNDYDFAPGALLVAEAGGRVANIGSDSYDYRNYNLVAANPKVFDAIMDILKPHAGKLVARP